jgi:hypothetical protein
MDLTKNHPLSRIQTKDLIEKAATVLNHYSSLYRALTNSWDLLGLRDFTFVLDSINSEIRRREQKVRDEIARDVGEGQSS